MDYIVGIEAFIISCSLWLASSQCPYQECFCSETMVLCANSNLEAIPKLLNANIPGLESLVMDNNKITTIPAGSLPSNMLDISLTFNPISYVDDTALDGSANTLTTLLFSNTRFTKIPNAFGHLRALTYLSITEANIVDWNNDAMKNLGKTLQTLYFENVGLTAWPSWIEYFSSLKVLTLSGGSISSVPDDAMKSFSNTLTSLSLNNNNFVRVPKAVANLTNLQELYLFENRIYDLTWLPQGSKLSSLSFSHNNISDAAHLSKSLQPFANSLISIDIDYNGLTEIPDLSFFTQIKGLDFTYNQISNPNNGAAPSDLSDLDLANNHLPMVPIILITLLSITDVSLSANDITAIWATDFHKFTSSVDVGYNQISELADTSFPPNSSIMFLQLNNNPLIRISNIALQNLVNLRELNIRATRLTRLPLALNVLTSLTTFDITNTTELICTCLESSLRPWVMSLMPDKVTGNCGQATLLEFFKTLSLTCPTQ